jgi:hypothetical protein
MSDDRYFLHPTKGKISDQAFNQLKSFARSIGPTSIVGFYYYSQCKMRPSKDADWIDHGPGIGLGGYQRADIPNGYAHHRDGIDFIIQIPPDIWASAKLGIIDRDPSVTGKFIIL